MSIKLDREVPQLSRTLHPSTTAPVRIVHLGLGAFHRSHQAWYTSRAGDAGEWGIAAFTGRRPDAALALAPQDGLFTVVERGSSGDSFEVVDSIVEAVDGADVRRLAERVAAPATAVVTLTITEAAYPLGPDGELDKNASDVGTDLALLAAGREYPRTPLGRLVFGLAARRAAGTNPLAVECCDNLANNGGVARRTVTGLAEAWDPALGDWIRGNVSFVSTSVDRITPHATSADAAVVRETCGYLDNAPVVAEPFSNWVLSGDFPAGRPRWEDAGAVFVDRIEPYENRKLRLLNGAHSLLAYTGQLMGHTTVAEALAEPVCRRAVEEFWDEAGRSLSTSGENSGDSGANLHLPEYRAALLQRFGNTRIAHHLAQIARDGSTKLRMRALPVLTAERSGGRAGLAGALMVAAWMDYTLMTSAFQDSQASEVKATHRLPEAEQTRSLLALLDPALALDDAVVRLIVNLRGTFRPPVFASQTKTF